MAGCWHTGILPDWIARSEEMMYPVSHVVVEVNAAQRFLLAHDFVRRWQDASPALRLTTLVAEYAEILKRSYWAREGDLDDVFRRAQRLSAAFEGDREVADFVSLAGRAAEIRERE